jgi:hypothetical protein
VFSYIGESRVDNVFRIVGDVLHGVAMSLSGTPTLRSVRGLRDTMKIIKTGVQP